MALTQIQKQAIKDVLHLMVDKEEPAVIGELLSKLPAPYGNLASLIFTAVNPSVEAKLDSAIDATLV